MLYDQYTRHVSVFQRFGEYAVAIASLGLGVADENSNGELVRVVDTTNGKICFEWHATKDMAEVGHYHADIAPSGQLVATLTQTTLAVYQLPTACTAK